MMSCTNSRQSASELAGPYPEAGRPGVIAWASGMTTIIGTAFLLAMSES